MGEKLKPKITLRKVAYPTMEELQPFINGHRRLDESSPDETTDTKLSALSSRVAYNAESLKASDKLRKSIPDSLSPKLKEVTDFFLNELAPILLAVPNGLQDAADVLELAFDEKPDVEGIFKRIEASVNLAVDMRVLRFVSTFAGLDAKETKYFFAMHFAKEAKSADAIGHLVQQVLANDEDAKKSLRKSAVRKESAKIAKAKSKGK